MNNKNSTINENFVEQEKVVSLFKFIQELNKLKHRTITSIKDYLWTCNISDIPEMEDNVYINYRDRLDSDEEISNYDDVLLSVKKADYSACPVPDTSLEPWLLEGWSRHENNVSHREFLDDDPETEKEIGNQISIVQERFDDNENRVNSYNLWMDSRDKWVENQKRCDRINSLFNSLYSWFFELKRDSETKEIIVASGMLYDRENADIKHPILTRRVKLDYDPDEDIITILDVDSQPEFYSEMLQEMNDINLNSINSIREELQINDYHPLDRNDTPRFLNSLVHQLSSDSIFSETEPEGWKNNYRLLITSEPIYIVRKRKDGTVKTIEQIIENISETGFIPGPLKDIVSGGKLDLPEDVGEISIDEQLAAVGGESVDILLSKEANREQLEIARRIELYNAVLVQGPPGTGKTHTIANLMGHFLAEGKSVLVTSHTTKALKVLKDKVIPGMQDLCVSVLEDSNVDMEKSVDGITSYMSRTTSSELKHEMDALDENRKEVIDNLANVRRKMFNLIKQECSCLNINGEDILPSEAATFVVKNEEALSYIPGPVHGNTKMPLSFEQLIDLYKSNEGISKDEEKELETELPDPQSILSPSDFSNLVKDLDASVNYIKEIESSTGWTISNHTNENKLIFKINESTIPISYPNKESIEILSNVLKDVEKIDKWMISAAVAGKRGDSYVDCWETLIYSINITCEFSAYFNKERFGHKIEVQSEDLYEQEDVFVNIMQCLEEKGKIPKLTMMLHKEYETALATVLVDGKQVSTPEDCNLVINFIKLWKLRQECAGFWDELMGAEGVRLFFDLDNDNQEKIAENWIPLIRKYLNWYENEYNRVISKIKNIGINENLLFDYNPLDSDATQIEKMLKSINEVMPHICDVCMSTIIYSQADLKIKDSIKVLSSGKRLNSNCCNALVDACNKHDIDAYGESYANLELLYEKYNLQSNRDNLINTISSVAPNWALAIKNREGIHGECSVPADIEDAWKWQQFTVALDKIAKEPYQDLQKQSIELSRQYRKITAEYAEKCGWYHLLRRTEADIDMKQSLQGWKQTIKKIGKGTGKNAPKYRAEARRLMSKCQRAVPAWIMPINKAMETLNPKENQFDVVIIDEASQSDISSLAILYMGKKLVIVGDDKQVSPMAIGVEIDKMNAIEQMYISNKIPNAHLYNGKTSIYDIAATTFHPLMLREHFRCVPDIIGFSNMLSYDYKIKPLREANSSKIIPAVVNYRVINGERDPLRKTNKEEARAIVSLMKACFNQPEYDNKTFGVISLLGDDQYKLIQKYIEREISPKDITKRDILCGNSASFQGDERDIIFLSLVDSNDEEGPLKKKSFGVDDADRKRYNVACSRAKDQLWVVNSLDASCDLKPGDIRKTLLDYATDPHAKDYEHEEIDKKSESPFEASVAKALCDRGYKIVQQWQVGAYRLDIVVVDGKNTVAIECDGERWHSGEIKIREDMERQTILERLGWKFIRIRGSEYYRNQDATICRVIDKLNEFGISPCSDNELTTNPTETSELLERIYADLDIIYSKDFDYDSRDSNYRTIQFALNNKNVDYRTKSNVDSKESLEENEKLLNSIMTTLRKRYAGKFPEQSYNDLVNNNSDILGINKLKKLILLENSLDARSYLVREGLLSRNEKSINSNKIEITKTVNTEDFQNIKPGTRVTHTLYKEGTVVAVSDDRISILFDNNSKQKDFVYPHSLNRTLFVIK